MAEKLIYASEARRAILQAEPRLSYLIDNIKGVYAVEVVRCKDCKHYAKDKMWCEMDSPPKSETHPNWYADDFCSYGERKEEE